MNYRDLEKVRQIVKEATTLDIVYAYDDFVFPEHVAFMIQFNDDKANGLYCYFHKDCNPVDKDKLFESLSLTCNHHQCELENKGSFHLQQKGEEFEIHFA